MFGMSIVGLIVAFIGAAFLARYYLGIDIITPAANILRGAGNAGKEIYRNDAEAFWIGAGITAGGVILGFVLSTGSLVNWAFLLMIIALWAGIYFASKRGEKLRLFSAVKRGADAMRPAQPAQPAASPPVLVVDQGRGPEGPGRGEGIIQSIDAGAQKAADRISDAAGVVDRALVKGFSFFDSYMSEEEQAASEALDIAGIEKALSSRIKGQGEAIEGIVKTLRRVAAGIRTKKDSPLCVFLFLGPTGTGKTELVKALADASKRPLVRFDMPNFPNQAGIWELIGSPKGYVGSDSPGKLVSEIQANPNAVLLLDEIEKADKSIWDPFLSILDEGRLKGQGSTAQGVADFRNVMIFLTSNLLAGEVDQEDEKALRNKVLEGGYFRPEILNRINRLVMFRRFSPEIMREIIAGIVQGFLMRFAEENKLDADIQVSRTVVKAVLDNIDLKFGARDAQRYVEKHIGDALADAFLAARASGGQIKEITVTAEGGDIKVRIGQGKA